MNKKPIVYVPPDAEINTEVQPLAPPKTRYEKSRAVIERNQVKKIIKGKYGQPEKDI